MVGHENAHLLPSKVIPAVHIGCGVKSCGSGIDQYRALCALCEIELLSPHRRSLLCLWKDHTGRISCCCHWFLASPLRLHFLLDVSLTCSMYLFVLVLGVCAHPSQVESVHVQILRLLFVPFEGGVCVCVRASSLFLALGVPSRWRPGSPVHVNLLHATRWLAARPHHLYSISSLPLPLLAHRKATFNVRLTF